jgi:uncharacterized protein YeaO (DUF488 family)
MIPLYTSYYNKWDKVPKDTLKIGISLIFPKWIKRELANLTYKELAPTADLLFSHKENPDEEKYENVYRFLIKKRFPGDELKTIVHHNMLSIANVDNYKAIIMFCYCKPGAFCHRHILANMFNELGISVEEYKFF